MTIILSRNADRELSRATRYFLSQKVGVEQQFRTEFNDVFQRISQSPSLGSPCYGSYRFMKFKKMRYVVYYRVLTDDLILIHAVAHGSRRPGYWLRRSKKP